MHEAFVAAFHLLPQPLKNLVSSVNGVRLQHWRYGGGVEARVAVALERERWTEARWEAWRKDRLQEQLRVARYSVPWYREWWESRMRNGGDDDWRELANWPILTKEVLRTDPSRFVREGAGRVWHTRTSGSTGTPLQLSISKQGLRTWYGLFEARIRRWNGVTYRDRWAIIGGQRVTAQERRHPPFWVWNATMHQLYVSAYHIAPWSAQAIVSAITRAHVKYLWGYASALDALAREVLEQGLEPPRVKVVFSNAEPLLDHQRQRIEAAFMARVVNTYSGDMVIGASECESGTFHLWPEAGITEVLDEADRPVPPGEVGRFICTGLINDVMPLIRYEVGDRGSLAPSSERCSCGRSLPILGEIEGRLDDVVITPDGRRIGRLDGVFKADLPIRRAQIVQDALDHIEVRVLRAEGYSAEIRRKIARAVHDRVGEMKVDVIEVDDLPLGPNGKFRGVISGFAGDRTNCGKGD